MNYQFILWIALLSYALHILEEYFYNWRDWANKTFHITASWTDFYLVNTFVLFFGLTCASIGWNCFWIALSFPGFMLVNAVVFHITPIIRYRNFSPGIITSLILFLPVVGFSYYYAYRNGAQISDFVISLAIGAILMYYPIILQNTKNKAFFQQ
ncbi:HXXEE domain-containing protein [Mucilaginibacter gilvus]|uniref:HXXEE domain-containing protein n=1 Tax=Mucilaginibacter gilvus TaxID=2305909 RepID=A0A3S3VFV0_9SPHI|nr:HXXEE domain-containing protein [Mucilaginibacter gilvus]RWY47378.1 HXXEE domain-containing protein [Mucilaginibacter gilvus]